MKNEKVVRTSDIRIRIGLDKENLPVAMEWESSDQAGGGSPQACKAMLLSLFDEESKDTLKIDLWTRKMQVMEMDRFFYQTLRSLAETYFRATQNKDLAVEMQKFVHYFGEQTEVFPKGS